MSTTINLPNEYYADMMRAVPNGSGYIIHDERGFTTHVSEGGMRLFAVLDRIFEDWRPVLEAWTEHYAETTCDHGVRFDDESFGWTANDYAFEPETEPQQACFIFCGGFHGDDCCLPAWFDAHSGLFTWDMSPTLGQAQRAVELRR